MPAQHGDVPVDRTRIAATAGRIAPFVRRTPIVETGGADFDLDPSLRLTFKLELTQHAGSFKARGAFANLLLREVPHAGVAAASGGNHGAAVAFAASRLGSRAARPRSRPSPRARTRRGPGSSSA